ncbi:MAG TPA: HGxxPAAW family protein [Nocardioides sp.]
MSDNHGNTPAAWTAVVIGLLAFVVAGVGLMLSPINLPIFWIGMVLLPVALIVFVIMTKMGLGEQR